MPVPKNPTRILLAVFLIGALLFSGLHVGAEQPKAGITVAPALVTLDITSSNPRPTAWVGVRNDYAVAVQLIAEIKGVNQNDGILAPTKDLPKEFENNLIVSPNTFKLEPGKSVNLQITIRDSSLVPPGGSYAAIVIRQVKAPGGSVGIQSAVSAGLFITKEEGAQRSLNVTQLQLGRFLWGMPQSATVTFKNTGNVLLVPRGSILITDVREKNIITKTVLNERSLSVFPGKELKLKTEIKQPPGSLFPGYKKSIVVYRFDGTDMQQTYVKKFFYIPLWIVVFTGAMAIVVIYIVFWRRNKATYLHVSKKSSKKSAKKTRSKKIHVAVDETAHTIDVSK